MNWMARAKEAFLGVPAHYRAPREPAPSPAIRWNDLSALRAAIDESLTGLSKPHAAVQAMSETGEIERYLVLADTASDAAELAAAIKPLAAPAQATICSLDCDGTEAVKPIAHGYPNDTPYDAIFATLRAANDLDPDALFAGLHQALAENGQLWLNLHRDTCPAAGRSLHLRGLLDDMLQQVPSRWRLRSTYGAEIPASAPAIGGSDARDALRARFDILSEQSRGGTLLGPLFASGCIAPEIDEDEEGRKILRALYGLERELIASGEVPASDCIYVARPRRPAEDRIHRIFEKHAGPLPEGAAEGMSGPLPQWIKFNLGSALQSARAADYAAPFPPRDLMYHTTGLERDRDFAQHGADILKALHAASPKPLNTLEAVLDFGVGVGRVARYFKGFAGRYAGVDIDDANLSWVTDSLPWVEASLTEPSAPFPFEAGSFDGVISISVFTHIDRETTEFYVDELHRVTRPGGLLFLTLHGERALARALAEEPVARLVGIPRERLEGVTANLAADGFDFAEQYTHLTRANYRYGTTFLSQAGAEAIFGRRFRVHRFVPGAIHSFQDLIVLEHSS